MSWLRSGLYFISFFCLLHLANSQVRSFALSDVELLPGPFYEAMQTDRKYMMEMDPDRLLAPYVREAGLKPEKESYGNWENTGLDGHIAGHYLSALSMLYAATGDKALLERLQYMLGVLADCQKKNGDGYLAGIPGGKSMWSEISAGKIEAGSFSLNGKWVPLYNIHKIYAGLRDAFIHAGIEQAREMLIDLTDWMVATTEGLSDNQVQAMLKSEHGGLNEVFADVYQITGDEKYLRLAERFSHQEILKPLINGEDRLTGMHANTQIPKVIGFGKIAQLSSNEEWWRAATFFWQTVTEDRSVSIGGNSVREHFNPVDDFSTMISSNQGPETCNTYNMLRLTSLLFEEKANSKYVDYYERALYNHILSTQHPDGGFVYFTPMRPEHYRVYSQPHTSFWCCVGSGLENHTKYGEMIYAADKSGIYINLFIPSRVNWAEQMVEITQHTEFPFSETSGVTVKADKKKAFTLWVRQPGWLAGDLALAVNGKPAEVVLKENGYVGVSRKWKDGDELTITTPMKTRVEQLPDESQWVSFLHGPIVLGAVTDSSNLDGMWAEGSRMGHVANGRLKPLDEVPMIVTGSYEDILKGVKREDTSSLIFSLNEVVHPDTYEGIKLAPFFQIHEARYMLYWPYLSPQELEEKLETLHEEEKKMLELESATIDQVATGEQQPETEHNFQGEKTYTGVHKNRHWRDATGWFSYDLESGEKEAKVLQVTYYGEDENRQFDLFINDRMLLTETFSGDKGSVFFDKEYLLPGDLKKSDRLTIRFEAHSGSRTAGVYHIRLLDRGLVK